MTTITFRWNTGKIELAAEAVLRMSATQLARLVKTATANAEEVKAELSAYLQGEIDKLYLLDIDHGDDVMIENRGTINKTIELG